MNGLEIVAALHGGFIVWPAEFERGSYREPLFAGSLVEALAYAERVLSPPVKSDGSAEGVAAQVAADKSREAR